MLQAPVFDGLSFDRLPFQQDVGEDPHRVSDSRLEVFPAGGGSNKVKICLGYRKLTAFPVLASNGPTPAHLTTSTFRPSVLQNSDSERLSTYPFGARPMP